MVSTDGHRLSKVERALEGGPELKQGIIIPRKGLAEIQQALENATQQTEIGVRDGHLFVRVSEVALSVKLIEAQFPHNQVIPKDNDKVAVCPRLALLEALRRISIMSSDKTWGIKFSLDKQALKVTTDNPTLGKRRRRSR